jgi:S1-C subfamily serine protease
MKAAFVALAVAALGSALLWARDPAPPGWQAAAPSVVEVLATGYGRQELHGSGAIVRAERVATVAHLVAGARSVAVRVGNERRRAARVVALDRERDLALLEVAGLDVAALPRAEAAAGVEVWMLSPRARAEALSFRVVRHVRARLAGVERDALEIEGDVDSGDSGAALVDADGRFVGLVFAASRERDGGYAIPAGELDALLGSG